MRYEEDPLAEQKLATWSGLIPELEYRVQAAADAARVIAPVESGKYKESISSDVGFDSRAKIIGRLFSKDWKAHWIEFGTIKEPAHATLRRAMERLGYKISASESTRKGRI